MVNVQNLLDVLYLKSQRKQIINLNIKEKNLQGNLDLSDFVNLEELNCAKNKLTSLNLDNCRKLKILSCWENQLTELKISHLNNLTELNCADNQLIQLNLPNPNQIWWINVSSNYLQDLNFLSALASEKLTETLSIRDNNFPEQDLSIFSRFVNLENLFVDNEEKINQGIYNRFIGSLEFLKNMSKLRSLDIRDTDIDNGLEYLPENVKHFACSANSRKDARCRTLYNLFADEQGKVETDYSGIKNFSQKLQEYKQWTKLNFSEKEIKEWINIGLIINEYELASYLKKEKHQSNTSSLQEKISKERWQDIHPNFNYQLRKVWENKDFSKEQIQEWIKAGTKLDDYEFVAWFRDTKNLTPEWITNYKEDYQVLSKRFKKYDLCSECNQPNTGEQWCKDCNASRLRANFNQWTSQSLQIDKFIQKYQLEATEANKFLEWIPYEQFANIKHLAEGGFGKVYKAKWKKGNIHHWDIENKQWQREKDNNERDKQQLTEQINLIKSELEKNKSSNANKLKLQELQKKLKELPEYKNHREIVLKSLNNSSESTDFLQETEKHKIIDDWFNNIAPCYGISQDPNTGNYLMVMKYMPEGNLRKYLRKNIRKLNLKDKFSQLANISRGLKDIHAKKLVHRDFHSGNILKGIEKTSCLITDLGLCKPVDELDKEDKIYGIMPYVAPEVLRNQPYTQASDIYSFGIVAYEFLSGSPPYYDKSHDKILGVQICQGLRPKFKIKIPLLLKDLINKCWDVEPKKRPTASELERILRSWKQDEKFYQQLQEAEEHNKTLSDDVKFPDYKNKIHSGATYYSRILPTKEITKILSEYGVNDKFSGSLLSTISLNSSELKSENITAKSDSNSLIIDFETTIDSQEESVSKTKKQLSMETQSKTNQEETKLPKTENQEYHSEPMEIDEGRDWKNVHLSFTNELIQSWKNLNFTYQQTKDWINAGFQTQDYGLVNFVRNNLGYEVETVLNNNSLGLESLKGAYERHLTQQTPRIIHNPYLKKGDSDQNLQNLLKEQLREVKLETQTRLLQIEEQKNVQPLQRKLTRGSFRSYLRQNAKKYWFINNKLNFSTKKDDDSKSIILPDEGRWICDDVNEEKINKWSQQVYQEIGQHWCIQCQRVGYCNGENYSNYCIDHICEKEDCENKWEVKSEQGEDLCIKHSEFQQKAQIVQQEISRRSYYDK